MILPLFSTFAEPKALIVDNLLIATYEEGRWKSAPESTPMGGLTAWRVGIGKVGAKLEIKVIEPNDAVGGNFVTEPRLANPNVIVAGRAPTVPRKVLVGAATAADKSALSAHLKKQGLSRYKPTVTRTATADLDGDGTKETIIEAQSGFKDHADSNMPTTACSMVLLVSKGRVYSIYEDYVTRTSLPMLDKLRAVADIDGDGNMEVIASSDYYEGQGASVWRWDGKKATKLAEAGAGA